MSVSGRIVRIMADIALLAASVRAKFGDPGVHAVVRAGRTVHAVSLDDFSPMNC
jgi:hypothetical protein